MMPPTLGLRFGLKAAVLGFIAGFALPANGWAGFRWERTTVEHTVPVGQDLVEVKFPFTNSGERPLTVVHLRPSCGCLVAEVDKTTIGPGEKAVVTGFLDARGLSGLQEKLIQVFSDESAKPAATLTLRVTIPSWLEITPRLIWWSAGEAAMPKEALVTLAPGANVKLTTLKSDDPRMAAVLKPEEDGRRYRIIVTPESTAAPIQTLVHLQAEFAGSTPRTYAVFAQVR